jgi:hypothetical protein
MYHCSELKYGERRKGVKIRRGISERKNVVRDEVTKNITPH